jgi:hypothetical protein
METMQTLSLAELREVDPQHRQDKAECDCCCPFCGKGKRPGPTNRTLGYNTETGAWICHRCHQKGILTDFQDHTPQTRPQRARRQLQRLAALPVPAAETPADVETEDWKQIVFGVQPLADTPGAAYLESRGIPLNVALRSRVRYHPCFYGRPAVVFAVRDLEGTLTAMNGRYIDGKVDADGNKALAGRTCVRFEGGLKRGVFATPGAWEAPVQVITEAPIDALSLHTAGAPTIALCGVTVREWMLARLAWKTVHLAFDNDPSNAQGKRPGEEAYLAWEAALTAYGTRVERLRPAGVKDWNEALQAYGAEAMQQALSRLYADVETLEDVIEAVYTGEYVFIEDLAAQNLLPCRFPLKDRTVDMNEMVREAVEAKDSALLDQIEVVFEKMRAKYAQNH